LVIVLSVQAKFSPSTTTWTSALSPNNCLWNMRWRARLRRYTVDNSSSPQLDVWGLVQNVDQAVLSKLRPTDMKVSSILTNLPSGSPPPLPNDKVPPGFIH